MAELEVVELTNDGLADLSIEEDSFDWMLVAISNQWNDAERGIAAAEKVHGRVIR